ncbi:uncharacterized protein LOC113227238 [Hyposmocoma kahamanoa]|uniref:uncharacterized protein LOC113227238 n=1 Tax=Hyposmocoma kahamanoa TaxID=1477025 RepID=UPI000E6D9205|nr:uncharacterized protein LOC113227238 [Hyposmocoma kahamanoa]
MSIKSQKSLYDECSEIVEKSYSVKSDDESISCEDEDECLARQLMNKMNPAVLSKLRRCFKKTGDKFKREKDIDRRVEEVMRLAAAEEGIEFASTRPSSNDPLWLDEKGFFNKINNFVHPGSHKFSTHALKLYQLLDPFGTGRVKWRQLVCRLVDVGARKTSSRADVWKPVGEKELRRLVHCKRETIVKLVSIERGDSFCYVVVSKGGRVGIYSGLLKLMCSYEVFYHRSGRQRRVKNCWITDFVYLSDVQCMILSASDRSLTVYDAATLAHSPIFCITGLPNIPTCMSYSAATSELALGSERGEITRLQFLQPKLSLFHQKSTDHMNYYFWMELSSPPHTSYCSITTWRRVHTRSVRRLYHTHDGRYLVSCSHDCNASVRIRHVPGLLDDYVFKVQRGVTCFHLVPSLHLLATGSADGVVRLFESTQTSPFATLASPGFAAVLDVAIVPGREIVFAYGSNCWLHIWDIYEECLLQTIKINFPFLGVLGKKVEFGAFCLHRGPARRPVSEEDNRTPTPPLLAPASSSRRPSSVCISVSGGLVLQATEDEQKYSGRDGDPEYNHFDRPELLVTCCDYVCTISLSTEDIGIALPPPGDMLRARRPSFWDLPDDVFKDSAESPAPPSLPALPRSRSPIASTIGFPDSQLLSPAAAEPVAHYDLDTLLENAGLKGILEKDFVMMKGLKHDLNKKLADMKANIGTVSNFTIVLSVSCIFSFLSVQIRYQISDYLQPKPKRFHKEVLLILCWKVYGSRPVSVVDRCIKTASITAVRSSVENGRFSIKGFESSRRHVPVAQVRAAVGAGAPCLALRTSALLPAPAAELRRLLREGGSEWGTLREWTRGAGQGEYLSLHSERTSEGAADYHSAGWTTSDDMEVGTGLVGHKIAKSGRRGKRPTSKIG